MKVHTTQFGLALIGFGAIVLWIGLASFSSTEIGRGYQTPSEATHLQMSGLEKVVAEWRARNGHIVSATRLAKYYDFGPGERQESLSTSEASAKAGYWWNIAAQNGDTRTQQTLVTEQFSKYSWDPTGTKRWLEAAEARHWAGAREALEKIQKLESDSAKPK